MTRWLRAIGDSWSDFSARIEALNTAHAGLMVFFALVLTLVGVAFGGVQAVGAYLGIVTRKKTAAEGGTSPIDTGVRRDLLNKIETEWIHERLHQGLRNAIRVDLKLTETLAAVRPMLRMH